MESRVLELDDEQEIVQVWLISVGDGTGSGDGMGQWLSLGWSQGSSGPTLGLNLPTGGSFFFFSGRIFNRLMGTYFSRK